MVSCSKQQIPFLFQWPRAQPTWGVFFSRIIRSLPIRWVRSHMQNPRREAGGWRFALEQRLETSRSGPGRDCLRIGRRNDGSGDDVRTKGLDLGDLIGRQDLGDVPLGPAHTTVGQRESDDPDLKVFSATDLMASHVA